jgi:hypothetical protein
MWWFLLAVVVVALVAGWTIDRRRHPRDVDGHANQERGHREGSPGSFGGPDTFG